MAGASADQRGVISGMLNLWRNLGLVTGASVMGAVFAWAVAWTSESAVISDAHPGAVAAGMRSTFVVATMLVLAAIAIAWASRARDVSQPINSY